MDGGSRAVGAWEVRGFGWPKASQIVATPKAQPPGTPHPAQGYAGHGWHIKGIRWTARGFHGIPRDSEGERGTTEVIEGPRGTVRGSEGQRGTARDNEGH